MYSEILAISQKYLTMCHQISHVHILFNPYMQAYASVLENAVEIAKCWPLLYFITDHPYRSKNNQTVINKHSAVCLCSIPPYSTPLLINLSIRLSTYPPKSQTVHSSIHSSIRTTTHPTFRHPADPHAPLRPTVHPFTHQPICPSHIYKG